MPRKMMGMSYFHKEVEGPTKASRHHLRLTLSVEKERGDNYYIYTACVDLAQHMQPGGETKLFVNTPNKAQP